MSRAVVVVDNRAGSPEHASEHGLAVWLEHGGRALLYDAGAGGALLPNLAALGLEPGDIAAVVLSHGHYDHAGGLTPLLAARREAGLATPVWCHADALGPHLKAGPGQPANIGASPGQAKAWRALGAELNLVDGPVRPWEGIWLLAPIPRRTPYEEPAPGLVTRDAAGRLIPDAVNDDLALVAMGDSGPGVLTGCAHAGVVNLLLAAEEAAGRPPALLMGGTHLGLVGERQREAALAELAARPGLKVAAGHCTGSEVMDRLARELGERFTPLASGVEVAW
jgi:7,8-dihydropterin-6-yl-methyl-4-(beta-D-ribofuranosyl)aminobenzene 5'-phosphate synthase